MQGLLVDPNIPVTPTIPEPMPQQPQMPPMGGQPMPGGDQLMQQGGMPMPQAPQGGAPMNPEQAIPQVESMLPQNNAGMPMQPGV